jgi:hypothetical protein
MRSGERNGADSGARRVAERPSRRQVQIPPLAWVPAH